MVQRSDMYTDAIYYENETTGETRWEPPQYWENNSRRHEGQQQIATLLDSNFPQYEFREHLLFRKT
jgi:hypothetical protein